MATHILPSFPATYLDQLRGEMRANRQRYADEGVSLIGGARDEWVSLPIDSRYGISVRPGFHTHEERRSLARGLRALLAYLIAA